ncbi:MAG: PASTA domain-containing protein [Coriobacteriia bacterium]
MAQDSGQPEYAAGDGEDLDSQKRKSDWPWILLAVVVLVVILLLWLYWGQPQQAAVTVINKTTEIPIVIPEPRPEPTVPTIATTDSAEVSTAPPVTDVAVTSKSSFAKPPVRNVSMPEIVGLTQSSAESKVKAAGLVPYLTYGDIGKANGVVISQWPLAGEQIPEGSEGFIQIQLRP